MTEHHDIANDAQLTDATNSHAPANASSRKAALLDDANRGAGQAQNTLDVCAAVPLHVRPVLNGYAEVQACGICSERALRRHIATGRVKRSVIRNGRRLRFVKDLLIAELLEGEG